MIRRSVMCSGSLTGGVSLKRWEDNMAGRDHGSLSFPRHRMEVARKKQLLPQEVRPLFSTV